jgi:hypothetical protein
MKGTSYPCGGFFALSLALYNTTKSKRFMSVSNLDRCPDQAEVTGGFSHILEVNSGTVT